MVKLLIGMPTYGGKMDTENADCLLNLQKHILMNEKDIELEFKFVIQDSLVQRARNSVVSYFLSGDFTHLMFIDSDIIFNEEDVITLIRHNKDIIVAAYPLKCLTMKEGFSEQGSYNYAININDEATMIEGDLIDVKYAATGFMLIQRSVFEKMIEKYPELEYKNDLPFEDNRKIYSFFDCVTDPVSRRYLSEDYTFCKRWKDLGGKIYLDISINLTHKGIKYFQGSYQQKLIEEGVIDIPEN